jgi:hypothetical protein
MAAFAIEGHGAPTGQCYVLLPEMLLVGMRHARGYCSFEIPIVDGQRLRQQSDL